VHVHIPRTFHGPIFAKAYEGRVEFSEAVALHLCTYTDRKREKHCFHGSLVSRLKDEEEWMGDKLHAETKDGHVRILYDDEQDPVGRIQKGLNARLPKLATLVAAVDAYL
jgi:hypothetical protein